MEHSACVGSFIHKMHQMYDEASEVVSVEAIRPHGVIESTHAEWKQMWEGAGQEVYLLLEFAHRHKLFAFDTQWRAVAGCWIAARV